jgi:gamma-glutamylcyclotransferase (GGCT)/AIG2-like uncharacterized protein YtfP
MPLLFCYGTLQIPSVIQAVVGRTPAGKPARLPGYARYRVDGTDYPGIVPLDTGETDGTLYEDITGMELETLDRFEGELYTRRLTRVLLGDGLSADAWAYCIAEGQASRLTGETWSLERFLETGLSRFMRSYIEYRKAEYTR